MFNIRNSNPKMAPLSQRHGDVYFDFGLPNEFNVLGFLTALPKRVNSYMRFIVRSVHRIVQIFL